MSPRIVTRIFYPMAVSFLYLSLGSTARPACTSGSLDDRERKLAAKIDSSAVYATPGISAVRGGNTLFSQPFDAARLQASGQPLLIAEHVGRTTHLQECDFRLRHRSQSPMPSTISPERQSDLV